MIHRVIKCFNCGKVLFEYDEPEYRKNSYWKVVKGETIVGGIHNLRIHEKWHVHHTSYCPERFVLLCISCHRKVHLDNSHPLHPKDSRQEYSAIKAFSAFISRLETELIRPVYLKAKLQRLYRELDVLEPKARYSEKIWNHVRHLRAMIFYLENKIKNVVEVSGCGEVVERSI